MCWGRSWSWSWRRRGWGKTLRRRPGIGGFAPAAARGPEVVGAVAVRVQAVQVRNAAVPTLFLFARRVGRAGRGRRRCWCWCWCWGWLVERRRRSGSGSRLRRRLWCGCGLRDCVRGRRRSGSHLRRRGRVANNPVGVGMLRWRPGLIAFARPRARSEPWRGAVRGRVIGRERESAQQERRAQSAAPCESPESRTA